MPEVSVIMPAYNAEAFIQQSIESVIAQSYSNWELLIVDDGSTDNTKAIIHSFCANDPRIKYYYQANGKQGKARNLALKHASGKYIAFLDADDIWFPEKLALQVKQLKEKKADLVFSDGVVFTKNLTDAVAHKNTGKGYFSGIEGINIFLKHNYIPILTVLAKKEIIDEVKGFNEELSIQNLEDYHLWLKLLFENKTLYGSDLILAAYRQHDSSSSFNDKSYALKVIDTFYDLKKSYQQYSELLKRQIKQHFTACHYSGTWPPEQYKKLIRKNCLYLANPVYNFIFQSLYILFGFQFTRRLINKTLNKN